MFFVLDFISPFSSLFHTQSRAPSERLGLNEHLSVKTQSPPASPSQAQCKVIAPLSSAIRHSGHLMTRVSMIPHLPAPLKHGGRHQRVHTFEPQTPPPFSLALEIQGWPTRRPRQLTHLTYLSLSAQASGQRRPTTRETQQPCCFLALPSHMAMVSARSWHCSPHHERVGTRWSARPHQRTCHIDLQSRSRRLYDCNN